MSIIKRLFQSVFLLILTIVPLSSFALPVSLEVEVSPNPIKVSEFADVTIKALDDNGNIDTSVADMDIWLEVEGFDLTDPDVVIPGGGIGFFEASDQGIKIFSKGLTIKKPGDYTLTVVDVYDSTIQGSAEIKVLADSNGPAVGTLSVTNPTGGSQIITDSIDVIGSTSFPNTPIVVFIDGDEISEGLSDQQGNFTIPVSGIAPGEHELVVNALDLEDQVIATSGPIAFTYLKDEGPLFLGVEILPSKEVLIREKQTIKINTAERVVSALLRVGDGTYQPTTKEGPGVFVKDISNDIPGNYPLDVKLSVDGAETEYEDAETAVVKDELRRIITLVNTDDPERLRSDLVWTYEGKIDIFKVRYGTNKNNLRLSLTTSKAEGTLIIADPLQAYYAQVFPVDEDGIVIGEPSEIIKIGPLRDPQPICGNGIVEDNEQCDDGNIFAQDGCDNVCQIEAPQPVCGNGFIEDGEQCDDGNTFNGDGCSSICALQAIEPVQICGDGIIIGTEECDDGNTFNGDGCSSVCQIEEQLAPPSKQSCYPEGIVLSTSKVNGKYYLTWAPVPKAREYIVYRAEAPAGSSNSMRIVGSTEDTMFEYPFDVNSQVDKFAWYAVEAVCDETGEQKQVGDVTKVKVGPEHTIVMLVLLTLLGIGGLRMIKS